MGDRGPAPKPTNLRILHGDRKDRINSTEPKPAAVEVKAPSWLTPPAKKLWKRLAPDLIAKGVLTYWDEELFAHFCWLSVAKQQALKDIATRGMLVPGEKQDKVKNPSLAIVRDLTSQMISIGSKFGLTPSDRTRLSMGDGGSDGSEDLFS